MTDETPKKYYGAGPSTSSASPSPPLTIPNVLETLTKEVESTTTITTYISQIQAIIKSMNQTHPKDDRVILAIGKLNGAILRLTHEGPSTISHTKR